MQRHAEQHLDSGRFGPVDDLSDDLSGDLIYTDRSRSIYQTREELAHNQTRKRVGVL